MLAEPLRKTGLCIVEESVADNRLNRLVGSVQLPKVKEDRTWYWAWLDDMTRPFNVFSLLKDNPSKSEWTFIRNKAQSRDVKDRSSVIGRYSSTRIGMSENFEQDAKRCATSNGTAALDVRLTHINSMAAGILPAPCSSKDINFSTKREEYYILGCLSAAEAAQ